MNDEGFSPPRETHAGREAALNSLAGGLASVLSKTSTAPIERCLLPVCAAALFAHPLLSRIKILFQQYKTTPPSMVQTLKNIYAAEGVRGLFRGNLVNLIKSSPESAVKVGPASAAHFSHPSS